MTPDEHWRRFRRTGDPAALGALFDMVSPEIFRVALSLARDAASAEDALQETWLVALRSAERHDPARPVVPWLVGILRRKVHEGRRAARRPDERRVRRRAPPADPAIDAESAEDTAQLRAAIDALPAPYREVAVLRWRYGLEPGEIADARGMPPGTVRSLLHRALGRLRTALHAAPALFFGARWPRGLGDVRRAVLRAAATKSTAGTAAALAGGLIVAKMTKTAVLVALGCLLLGAGAVVQIAGRTAAPVTRTRDETAVAANRETSQPKPRAHVDEASAEPTTGAAAETPFARGIVVDEGGAPIVGCRVVVRGHESHAEGESQEAPVRIDSTAAAVTEGDGRFVVPKKPDDLASLNFLADGFEVAEVRDFDADLRVVLAPIDSFAARVVDTGGRPISGADVRVLGPWSRPAGESKCIWIRTLTDSSGRFEFLSLPRESRLGPVSAWGYRLQGPDSYHSPLQDEYVMERTCLLVDVADAGTHAALDGAHGVVVGSDGALVGNVEPQRRGASSLPHPGRLFWSRAARWTSFVGELRVFAPGHHAKTVPVAIAADAEPPHLAIELDPGDDAPVVAGRLADGAGALVEARFAPQIGGRKTIYGDDLSWPVAAATTAGADGAFSIGGIPRGTYRLTVTRAGDPPFSLDIEAPATSLELRFPGKAVLEVRYTDTSGRPVAGAWVHVQTTDERFGWDLQTDAEGRARFDALPAAEVDVIPIVRGVVPYANFGGPRALDPCQVERRTLAAGPNTRVDLVRPDRCRLTVVVREDTGSPVRDAELRVEQSSGLFDQDEVSRLRALDLTTDAEGRATFEIYPCRGTVKALRQGHVDSATFYAEPGSAPLVEIVLPTVVGRITGRVVERSTGAAVTARPVTVWWDRKIVARSATGDDGRFVASGVPAGRVRVSIAGYTDANDPQEGRFDHKSPYGFAEVEFDMAAGEEHALALTLPRIKGRDAERSATAVDVTVVDEAGAAIEKAWLDVRGRIDGAWCSLGEIQTDAAGRAHLDVVAAERYVIRARRSGSSYAVGATIVNPPQASVERDPARAIVERFVLPAK